MSSRHASGTTRIAAAAWIGAIASACSFDPAAHVRGGAGGNGGYSGPRTGNGGTGVRVDGSALYGDGAGRVIGGGPLGDAACAVQTQRAEQLPLDLYVLMDTSGSMDEMTATGQTKWDAVRMALTAFLDDQQSAGIGVGLQYFPLIKPNVPDQCANTAACGANGPCQFLQVCNSPNPANQTTCNGNADCPAGVACVRVGACLDPTGTAVACFPAGANFVCNGNPLDPCVPLAGSCLGRDICDAAAYATPAVEVATLPGAAPALVASLSTHMPDGLTPTGAALSGAIAHAQALARANPTHRVAVLLATDGLPSECTPLDIGGISTLASVAASATPAISTFVIGVFAPAEATDAQTNLDAIAAAGGTGRAFVINTTQNVSQAFVSALNAIRVMGLSCEYKIPAPPSDGGTLDYFRINVAFTASSGQQVTIGNVRNKAACNPTMGGWYYDVDPTTGAVPSTISICEPTCSQLRGDPAGRVDVLLGCQTETIIP